ncbi:hypothetical protein LOTGIDRAFT_176753, partial [Lottia gigantea]
ESYCTEKEYKIFPDQKYCLKHFSTGQTWEDDNIRCRQDSGYLISVYTRQDLTNLRSLNKYNHYLYIGAHRKWNGRDFVWTTGGTVSKMFWNSGEPNSAFGTEMCATLLPSSRFDDIPCNRPIELELLATVDILGFKPSSSLICKVF